MTAVQVRVSYKGQQKTISFPPTVSEDALRKTFCRTFRLLPFEKYVDLLFLVQGDINVDISPDYPFNADIYELEVVSEDTEDEPKKEEKTVEKTVEKTLLKIHPFHPGLECKCEGKVFKPTNGGFDFSSLADGKHDMQFIFRDDALVIDVGNLNMQIVKGEVTPNFCDLGATILPMLFSYDKKPLSEATLSGNFHPHNSPSINVTGKTDDKGMKTILVPPGKLEVVAEKNNTKVEHNAFIPSRERVASAKAAANLPLPQLIPVSTPATTQKLSAAAYRAPNVNTGEISSPYAGGRVHFTGGLVHHALQHGSWSKAFEPDTMGEFVGIGRYPTNSTAFPIAIRNTFDGVVVDAGTKIQIFSKPNFQGTLLYSKTGPAIVCNSKWIDTFPDWEKDFRGTWPSPLGVVFPTHVREFSGSNMHLWNTGSTIISGGEPIPEFVKKVSGYIGM